MNHLAVLPVWQLLMLVVVVAAGTSIPSAVFGATRGARMAIELCSQHWGCPLAQAGERAQNTADLADQLAALRAAHPEIAVVRAAMHQADSAPVRTRAKEDVDLDGHK